MDNFVYFVCRFIAHDIYEANLLKNWKAVSYDSALNKLSADCQFFLWYNWRLFFCDVFGLKLFPDDWGQENENAKIPDTVF